MNKRRAATIEGPVKRQCMAKHIPEGEVLTDLRDKKWRVGSAIGIGGFGEIYLASDDTSKPVHYKSDFVVKIEPFMSGPLFVEIHVYSKIGKEELINEYTMNRKLKALGMPHFLGCGSHYFNNERYRFIVLPKYGIDLQTVFLNSGKKFSVKTAFTLATYVIDVLEYIHGNGYVHADIKASNMVLDKQNRTPVYLLDYGLSCKFYDDVGNHKKLESDQRKAHNGTLIFTSRDAHVGAHSRRGDLEVLGYNLVQWITGSLPWEGNTDAEIVAEYKKKMMNNISSFIDEHFHKNNVAIPDALVQYLRYVNGLKFKSKPDYQYCRKLFRQAVRDAGFTFNGDLSLNVNWLQVPKKRYECISDRENDNKYKVHRPLAISVNPRRPCTVRNFNPRLTRKSLTTTVRFDWPKILAGHPEKPNGALPMLEPPHDVVDRLTSANTDSTDSASSELLYTRGLDNPTPQMKEVLDRLKNLKSKTPVLNENALPVSTKNLRNKRNITPQATEAEKSIVNHDEKLRRKDNNKTKKKATNVAGKRKKASFSKNCEKQTISKPIVSRSKARAAKKSSPAKLSYVKSVIIQNSRVTRNTWANLKH